MPSDRRLLGVLPGGALLASVLLCAPASAAVIQVNTTEDLASGGGKCSLRQAVITANTDAAPSGSDCTAGPSGGNTLELPKDEDKLTIEKTVGDNASSGDLNIT